VKTRLVLEEVAAEHRAAIEAFARTAESLDIAAWNRPRDEGKWTPAQIVQHLILSYEAGLRELEGGAGLTVVVPWWKRVALRWTILPRILAGRFPAGAPAPREIRPKTSPESPEAAVGHLRACAERFAAGICEADRAACLTHPYFGRLKGPQILRFLAVHARHHHGQLPASPSG
jgi:hypothetical protein